MSGGNAEINRDDSPFAYGTHKSLAASAFLYDPGKDFKSCGVQVGVVIKNTTDESEALTTAVYENRVEATLAGGTNNHWAVGDEYEIYRTATYNSLISTTWVDRRFGQKTMKSDLENGLRPEDIDLDQDGRNVFGPQQPEKP